jgi:hypothetical protein
VVGKLLNVVLASSEAKSNYKCELNCGLFLKKTFLNRKTCKKTTKLKLKKPRLFLGEILLCSQK